MWTSSDQESNQGFLHQQGVLNNGPPGKSLSSAQHEPSGVVIPTLLQVDNYPHFIQISKLRLKDVSSVQARAPGGPGCPGARYNLAKTPHSQPSQLPGHELSAHGGLRPTQPPVIKQACPDCLICLRPANCILGGCRPEVWHKGQEDDPFLGLQRSKRGHGEPPPW